MDINEIRDLVKQDRISNDELAKLADGPTAFEPRISKSVFEEQILPLLSDILNEDARNQYLQYVGQPSNRLLITADNDIRNVLFMVPSLMASPQTTIPGEGTMSAYDMLRYVEVLRDRIADTSGILASRLNEVFGNSSIYQQVLKPIVAILDQYGRVLNVRVDDKVFLISPRSVEQVSGESVTVQQQPKAAPGAYSDEYDD